MVSATYEDTFKNTRIHLYIYNTQKSTIYLTLLDTIHYVMHIIIDIYKFV